MQPNFESNENAASQDRQINRSYRILTIRQLDLKKMQTNKAILILLI